MAHYQNQYDPARQTDEYGNSVGQRDDYGNPIGHHNGTTGGEYGTVGYETDTTEAGKYGGAPGSGTYNKEQYGNPVGQRDEYGNPIGQRDEYGNPIGHHNGTTGGEYDTVGYETTTTEAGKYGGAPGSGTYNKEQHGNPVGQRDEYGNPIGHYTGTTGGEYGTDGYETAQTGAGKYGGARGSGTSTTPGGYYSEEQRHEKKGIMDKIKEKLPGHRHDH